MTQLTPSQRAALALDKNIAVTAGAGTGKTLVLVERYISILLHNDVDLHEVLAITFTNKAAAEMLERVESTLNSLLTQSEDSKEKKRLTYIRDHLSSAHVSTIHSFCARLLREFPMEAGNLDPGFGLLSSEEMAYIIEESISEVIAGLDSADEQWLGLFRLFGAGRIKQMLRETIANRYEQGKVETYFNENDPRVIFEQIASSFLQELNREFKDGQIGEIASLAGKLLAEIEGQGPASPQRTKLHQLLYEFSKSQDPGTTAFWQTLFLLTDYVTTGQGKPYTSVQYLGGKKSWREPEAQLIPTLSKQVQPIAQWRQSHIHPVPAPVDQRILENLTVFNLLARKVRERFQEKKLKQRVVDYEDLQLMTLQLLSNNDEICRQVSGRFRFIMVDEFQDTNQLQWEIISKLAGPGRENLFIVGDPKQSIYGFRSADVRVFNRVRSEFRAGQAYGDQPLFESFRFRENINYFINLVFQEILQTSSTNPWAVGYEAIETRRTDADGGQVELAVLDKSNDENIQAAFTASRINQMMKSGVCRAGDVAILLRSRTHLMELEKYLREGGIPYRTIGGIGFYQGQEINDIYHLLRFLINPADDYALTGLLRSPFADLSDEGLLLLSTLNENGNIWDRLQIEKNLRELGEDDRQTLTLFRQQARTWLKRRNRIGYYELLSEILSENLYRPIAASDLRSEQILANIDKLMGYILDHQYGYFPSIIDLAESLNRLINTYQKEGEAVLDYSEENTVKIMTIHQAKGLEFPVVFLPYLEQQIKPSPPFTTYFDERYGAVSRINEEGEKENDNEKSSSYIYELVKSRKRQKELAELRRLFYVACTRARDQLILCGSLKKGKTLSDTQLDWLLNAINRKPEELDSGPIQLGKNLNLIIHRRFEYLTDSGQQRQLMTIESLDKIKALPPLTTPENGPAVFQSTPDIPKKEIFSATQLMTFMDNRQEYARRYQLGFFKDDYEKLGLGIFEESDALLRGTLVHRMMERLPDFEPDDLFAEIDISDDRQIEKLKSELTRLYHKVKSSEIISTVLRGGEYKTEVSILKAAGDDFLTGTLDRIYRDINGQWVIIDYKSNKVNEQEVAGVTRRYMVQVEIYALLLASLYPGQKTFEVGLYFIYPDLLEKNSFSRDQIGLLEKKYLQVIAEIKQYYPYTEKLIS